MNRIRDELRRAKRRSPPEELADDIVPAEWSLTEIACHLRDVEREATVARIELECSYDEMAVMLGKPSPNAARVAVRRAVVRLALKMNDAG